MKDSLKICGWQINHQEKLIYQANKGNPFISLKFFNYPNYRQNVLINRFPAQCRIKSKGCNSFFLFNHKVRTKGVIPLERTITVIPKTSFINPEDDWGKISDFPLFLPEKYQQNLEYWSIKSELINDISNQQWFKYNELSKWVQSVSHFIKNIIKHREKQEKRLGAHQAIYMGIGDCDEFTDLLITISRIRGIPCRRLTGYFKSNKESTGEAHAWGEIFSPKKGWIPIDIALNNIGYHTINYIILKIEEFNSSLSDYQIQVKHTSTVHYKWEIPNPIFSPIY